MSRYLLRRAALAAIAAKLVFAAAGCESKSPAGDLKGQVTFQGKPVTEGTVTLLNPTEGGAFEAQINSDGRYAVGGVTPGEFLVVITPPVEIVDTDPGKSPPAPVEKAAPNIPRKYRMQGTTPFKAAVQAGPNELNFEMKP
jgi:hypothetical protein